jgi:hypothetical protein
MDGLAFAAAKDVVVLSAEAIGAGAEGVGVAARVSWASHTSTRRPSAARGAATVSPAIPEPMIRSSNVVDVGSSDGELMRLAL